MLKRLKLEIKQLLKDNLKGYILICGTFIAGIALSYILNISSGSESEIKLYIDDFLSTVNNYSIDSEKTFSISMIGYIKDVLILFLMSLSVVGSVGTVIYVFIKGFSYGIVMVSAFNIIGIKSLLLFLCLILPHALISVPCFVIYSLYCMKNSYSVSKGVRDIKARILAPFAYGVFCTVFLSVSALIQAYFEPVLTRMII